MFLLQKMETQQRICRFCLKVCSIFEALEGNMKAFLDRLLPKINLVAVEEPVMCINCAEMLVNSFGFKADCLYKQYCIASFARNKATAKLDLRDVYLSQNEYSYGVPEDHEICVLCINPVKNWFAVSLSIERQDVMLEKMIEQCLSELDISIIKKPVICVTCCRSLESCFYFVTNCLMVEEKIKRYCESLGINSNDQIQLSTFLQFAMKNVTRSEVDGSSVDLLKVEEQFCEERENADKREFGKGHDIFKLEQSEVGGSSADIIKVEKRFRAEGENTDERETGKEYDIFNLEQCEVNGSIVDIIEVEKQLCEEGENTDERESDKEHDIFKLEQAFCDISENVKEEIEPENTNFMDTIDLTFNDDDQFPSNNMMADKEESNNNRDIIKVKETYCDEFKKFLLKGGIKIKPAEPNSVRCDNDVLPQSEVPAMLNSKQICAVSNLEGDSSTPYKNQTLTNKKNSKMKMFQCKYCLVRAKRKSWLENHLLMHKDPSEITMYKCDSCSFQTKYKCYLKKHLIVHKSPSAVTMYKCNSCSFRTKDNNDLKMHLLKHQNPPEVSVYDCGSCSYQTDRIYRLKRHMLTHRGPLEETIYKCDSCVYQTNNNRNLKRHLLRHKDPSEVTVYSCNTCPYQTKF